MCARLMARSRRMRSSSGGWVLNSPPKLTPLSGLTMNMWATAGFTWQRAHAGRHLELLERAGERLGIADDARAGIVGAVLARARDRQLNQRGGDRRQDDQQQLAERVAVAVVAATHAAEDHGPLRGVRQQGDGTSDRGGDARDQNVVVADVAELVGEHALKLVACQDAE